MGGGIGEGSVLFLDPRKSLWCWRWVFLILPLRCENDHGTFAMFRNPFFLKFAHNSRQHGVIKTLAMSSVKVNVEPAINPVDFFPAPGHEHLPESHVFRITGMQLGRFLSHGIGDRIGRNW